MPPPLTSAFMISYKTSMDASVPEKKYIRLFVSYYGVSATAAVHDYAYARTLITIKNEEIQKKKLTVHHVRCCESVPRAFM